MKGQAALASEGPQILGRGPYINHRTSGRDLQKYSRPWQGYDVRFNMLRESLESQSELVPNRLSYINTFTVLEMYCLVCGLLRASTGGGKHVGSGGQAACLPYDDYRGARSWLEPGCLVHVSGVRRG